MPLDDPAAPEAPPTPVELAPEPAGRSASSLLSLALLPLALLSEHAVHAAPIALVVDEAADPDDAAVDDTAAP